MEKLAITYSCMEEFGLQDYFDRIVPYLKSALTMDLTVAEDEDIPIGVSKLGGLPDLPENVDWFRNPATGEPLSFICQINFQELKSLDEANKLPAKGMLYLFYDCSGESWGFAPEDAAAQKVYYYSGSRNNLERKEPPEDYMYKEGLVFGAAGVGFMPIADLPYAESEAVEALELGEEEYDTYCEMVEEFADYMGDKLLGYPNIVQSEMEEQCEYVANGIDCGNFDGYAEGRARGLAVAAQDWHLLLQINTHEDLGMVWGDSGRLFLWIKDSDLARKRFDKAWVILQSY